MNGRKGRNKMIARKGHRKGGEERKRQDLVEIDSICDSSFILSISPERRRSEEGAKERRKGKRKKI